MESVLNNVRLFPKTKSRKRTPWPLIICLLIACILCTQGFLFLYSAFLNENPLASLAEIPSVDVANLLQEELSETTEIAPIPIPSDALWMPTTFDELTSLCNKKSTTQPIPDIDSDLLDDSWYNLEDNIALSPPLPSSELTLEIQNHPIFQKLDLETKILSFLKNADVSFVKVDGDHSRIIIDKCLLKINEYLNHESRLLLTEVTSSEIIFSDESGTRYKKSITKDSVEASI